MADLKRKKNESFEGFIRRVKQQWQRSGTILQARKIKYFTPKKSKNFNKNQAVSRSKLISKTAYLQKTGKMPVDDRKNRRRR